MSARWALICSDSVLLRPVYSILSAVFRKRPRRPDLPPPTSPAPVPYPLPLSQELLQLLTRVAAAVFVFSALLFSALAHDDGLCAMRVVLYSYPLYVCMYFNYVRMYLYCTCVYYVCMYVYTYGGMYIVYKVCSIHL